MRGLLRSLIGTRAVSRIAERRSRSDLLILLYHDLRDDDDFENWLRVSQSDFDAHLTMFAEMGKIIHPDDLAEPDRLSRSKLNILITFDDGYLNNHRLALPVLAKHEATALFFISTGHLQSQEPFWPDKVITPIQVAELSSIDLSSYGLDVHTLATGDPLRRWDDIQRLLVRIKSLGNTTESRVATIIDHFETRYGDILQEHLPRFRPLNPDEIRAMHDSGYGRFASHGHDHHIMTYLDDDNLVMNLDESRKILSALIGHDIVHLAYPNGTWDQRVAARAGQAGFRFGYTVEPGLALKRSEPMALPRLGVGGLEPPAALRSQINRVLLRS